MSGFIEQFFNIQIMVAAWPTLFRGLAVTLMLCLAVIPMGLFGGLVAALASNSNYKIIRWPTIAFVDFFRSIPPLVLLIFVYSGLPFAGIRLSPFLAVVIAFFLNNSAYYGEILRAGLNSVGYGQTEAARSTGLNVVQTHLYVILPQAVRNVLPDLLSNTIEVIKLTSLASVVSLAEILYSADMARSITYNASPIVLAAFIYLMILWPLVRLVSQFGKNLDV